MFVVTAWAFMEEFMVELPARATDPDTFHGHKRRSGDLMLVLPVNLVSECGKSGGDLSQAPDLWNTVSREPAS